MKMRKNRKMLFLNPIVARGRRLRNEGEHGGDASQQAPVDNAGGNFGGQSDSNGDSNNNGQEFDPAAFWTDPADEGNQNSGSDSNQGGAGGQDDLQTTLTQRLDQMTFGDPIFTAEIAEQINNGDFSGFESRMQSQMRTAVRQSLGMVVSILRPYGEQLTQSIETKMSQTFNQRDNNQSLEELFPAAKNANIRPVIQGLYDRALQNTKGNRAEAVKQTKSMIQYMAGETANDLDISIAPRSSESTGRPAAPTNWIDELTMR